MADKNEKTKKTISSEEWGAIDRHDVTTEVNSLMRNAYLQYSVSANVGRAIPDVRDGLKPGARRILYAMLRGGYTFSGGLNKCAKVVGLVIGNYHPHGDTAVYDTIVRMAQDFSMRVPLIIGHGNFGSMDGDGAAAYRYTECKMDKTGEALLADLDKETVDMRDTFDGKELEPIVLPAAFPNLLVNGSQGIGVGMATNVPPHNLGESIDAAVALIDNPNITLEELMEVIPGPDFPTGGIIHGTKGVRQLYATGQGGIRVRGKVEIVDDEHSGSVKIVVTEIPYGVNKAEMVGRIGELASDNVIHGVKSVNDYSSSRAGVKIEIALKQDAVPNVVLNEIYRNTPLEITYPAQFLVVDHNRPCTMNLKQILEAYVDHREQVVIRRTKYLLRKALERDHIVEGLLIAQANIDEVIRIIRASKDRASAQQELMARFSLDELQTNAILDMRLSSLTQLSVDDLTAEHNDLQAKITEYNRILSCRENIMEVVKKELLETKAKFNTPRRTFIENSMADDLDGLTKREMYVVTLSKQGYIKRCSEEEYAAQNRGGSGVIGMRAKKDGDTVQMVLGTRSHNALLFFTSYGRVYRLRRAYELPDAGRGDTGRFIHNVLPLIHDDANPEAHEEIRAILSVDESDPQALESKYVVMVTRNGIVKRMKLELFKHVPKAGKRALTFKEDADDLIDAQMTDGDSQIIISTDAGRAVRFLETQVRDMGVSAAGVRGITLKPWKDGTPSVVVAMTVVNSADDLLVVTANGLGKRTPIGEGGPAPVMNDGEEADSTVEMPEPEEPEEAEEVVDENDAVTEHIVKDHYRLTRRGSQGVTSIKLRDGDRVVAALQVEPECEKNLLMLSKKGQAVRIPVDQVKRTGRNCYGVIVMRFSKNGDGVANVSLVDKLSEEDAAANEAKSSAEQANAEQAAAFDASRAADEAALQAQEDERIRLAQEAAENGEEPAPTQEG